VQRPLDADEARLRHEINEIIVVEADRGVRTVKVLVSHRFLVV
jgi:hypothetical protein